MAPGELCSLQVHPGDPQGLQQARAFTILHIQEIHSSCLAKSVLQMRHLGAHANRSLFFEPEHLAIVQGQRRYIIYVL